MGVAQYHIINFIDPDALQIIVGQKGKENQWSYRVVNLQEFLYIALLYQAMTNVLTEI